MQDFPAAEELLDAVAAYLFGELRPQVPKEERFKLLVAANVCAVVAREIRAGGEPTEADAALFAELLGDEDASEERDASGGPGASGERDASGGPGASGPRDAADLARDLAAAIRSGSLDGDLDALIARLPEHVKRKLDVARPGYAD